MPQITTEWIHYLNHFVHPLWLGCSLFSLTHSSLETALSSCLTMQKSMLPQIKTYIHALLVVIIWIVPLYTALVEVILSLYLFIIYHAWNFTGCISSKLPELQTKKQKSKTLFLTHFFLQMRSLYCSAKKTTIPRLIIPKSAMLFPKLADLSPIHFRKQSHRWYLRIYVFISLRLMPPAFAGLEIASSMARSTTKSSSSNNSTILSIASSMARSTTKSNSNSSNNQQQQ